MYRKVQRAIGLENALGLVCRMQMLGEGVAQMLPEAGRIAIDEGYEHVTDEAFPRYCDSQQTLLRQR